MGQEAKLRNVQNEWFVSVYTHGDHILLKHTKNDTAARHYSHKKN